MSRMWKGKRVLVTGSEGLIGRELVIQLIQKKAKVAEIDIVNGHGDDISYKHMTELIFNDNKPEIVFHLAGIKGNPKMTKERPVDFMGPMLQFDTNMILAANKHNVKSFLYTSSIAVENPESDKYPAWAKMTAETLIEAMRIQYPKGTKYCIVRPANVYGRFDNFDNPNAMVITSLINKALKNETLVLDRKGSQQERDLINAKDVARNMIKIMEDMPDYPINLCSGKETKIKDIAEIIGKELNIPIKYKNLNIVLGPEKKIMKQNYKLNIQYDLEKGIKEVIEYVKSQKR